jgi:hypothetical protein
MRSGNVLLASVIVLAACGETSNPIFTGTTQARVRFINATTDVPALTFNANGQTVVQSLPFGQPSSCQTFNPGSVTFTATPGSSTSTFGGTLNQTLPTSGRFSVVALGTSALPQFLFLNDASTAASAGNARLRIINAVPGSTAADIFVTVPGNPLGVADATNVGFASATTFLDVPAGPTQIRFANTGTQNVTFTGDPFTLSSGQRTTVVVAPGTTLGTFRSFVVDGC